MGLKSINSKIIYKPAEPVGGDVFAYVRAFNGKEVGFSVLDEATRKPDFSNCGIFWVRPEDFALLFKAHMAWK